MNKNKKANGQSLAEFALILPLFLLVVMGIFDLGRGVFIYSTIHNAAREGARYGAVDHCDTAGIKDVVQERAVGLKDGLLVGDPVKYFNADGRPERIVVTVSYDFQTVTPLVGKFLGDQGKITLESQARQLIELPATCP